MDTLLVVRRIPFEDAEQNTIEKTILFLSSECFVYSLEGVYYTVDIWVTHSDDSNTKNSSLKAKCTKKKLLLKM